MKKTNIRRNILSKSNAAAFLTATALFLAATAGIGNGAWIKKAAADEGPAMTSAVNSESSSRVVEALDGGAGFSMPAPSDNLIPNSGGMSAATPDGAGYSAIGVSQNSSNSSNSTTGNNSGNSSSLGQPYYSGYATTGNKTEKGVTQDTVTVNKEVGYTGISDGAPYTGVIYDTSQRPTNGPYDEEKANKDGTWVTKDENDKATEGLIVNVATGGLGGIAKGGIEGAANGVREGIIDTGKDIIKDKTKEGIKELFGDDDAGSLGVRGADASAGPDASLGPGGSPNLSSDSSRGPANGNISEPSNVGSNDTPQSAGNAGVGKSDFDSSKGDKDETLQPPEGEKGKLVESHEYTVTDPNGKQVWKETGETTVEKPAKDHDDTSPNEETQTGTETAPETEASSSQDAASDESSCNHCAGSGDSNMPTDDGSGSGCDRCGGMGGDMPADDGSSGSSGSGPVTPYTSIANQYSQQGDPAGSVAEQMMPSDDESGPIGPASNNANQSTAQQSMLNSMQNQIMPSDDGSGPTGPVSTSGG